MDNVVITLIVAVLSSGALSALINGYFQSRRDKQSKETGLESKIDALAKKQNEINNRLIVSEKDALRTQLMVLIKDFPDERTDILRLSETYFSKLGGNWILTDIFVRWCRENGVEVPTWYKGEKE